MSVAVCLQVTYATPALLIAVLSALADLNFALYSSPDLNLSSPWEIPWNPDLLEVCDAKGCRLSDSATLYDVVELQRRKHGSCGPLACAYAAYARVLGAQDVSIELIPDVEDAWHVVAHADGQVLNPQVIGAQS